MLTAPEGSSLQYMERYLKQVEQIAMAEVEKGNARRILSRIGNFGGGGDVNVGRVVLSLSDFDERKESAQQIAARLRPMLPNLAGVRATVVTPGGLGIRGFGPPVQVVLGGGDYEELARWRDIVLAKAAENPGLTNLDSDYYARKPQLKVSRRSQPRRRSRRVADDRRPHAGNDDGLAHRHDVPRSRRGIQRDAAGPRERPRDAERPDEYLRALVRPPAR